MSTRLLTGESTLRSLCMPLVCAVALARTICGGEGGLSNSMRGSGGSDRTWGSCGTEFALTSKPKYRCNLSLALCI